MTKKTENVYLEQKGVAGNGTSLQTDTELQIHPK